MISVKAAQAIKINKLAILFVTAIAPLIGISPAVLLLDRFDSIFMIVIAITVVMAATLGIRSFSAATTERPGFLEYFVGGIGAIFLGTLSGFILLFVYAVSFGIISLIRFIGAWLGAALQVDTDPIAFWASFLITVVFIMFLFGALEAAHLGQQLYPNKARTKSVFYDLVTFRRRKLISYVGFGLLIPAALVLTGFLITGTFTSWVNLLLLVDLSVVSLFPYSMAEKSDPYLPRAIKAVGKVLEAVGYTVVVYPTTGKPEYDPFLASVDLFAHNNQRGLSIVVRYSGTKFKDRWDPSDLLRSTVALQMFLEETSNLTFARVIPVAITIGKEREKWEKSEVEIVHIPDRKVISEISKKCSQEKLKRIAEEYLRFSNDYAELNPRKADGDISGEETDV